MNSFEKRFDDETELLREKPLTEQEKKPFRVAQPGSAGEPWVEYTSEDWVGLALSGGGIRSATFNLGLLQGLHDLGLLKYIHYLSTVSGGGYIGGWWTAWRARRPGLMGEFPQAERNKEPGEVRHLREFSNFLSPRIGFFEIDTWNCVVAFLSGLLPSLAAALSVIVLALMGWAVVVAGLWLEDRGIALGVLALVTALVFILAEAHWRRKKEAEPTEGMGWAYFWFAVLGIVFALVFHGLILWYWQPATGSFVAWLSSSELARFPRALDLTEICPSGPRGQPAFCLTREMFIPAFDWLAAAGVFVVFRFCLSGPLDKRWQPASRAAWARIVGRLLAMAVVWSALVLVWESGQWINRSATSVGWSTTFSALASSGLFSFFQKWVQIQPKEKTKNQSLGFIKQLLPQILAYITVALLSALMAALLLRFWHQPQWCVGVFSAMCVWLTAAGILVIVWFCFDLTRVGLHDFYRGRIARAYLGASMRGGNADAAQNRQTEERALDDLGLACTKRRPLHLVCCAANNLAGDRLASLSRGARSGVLSALGFSLGDMCLGIKEIPKEIKFSSALTASAAAFNSNMGSLSIKLGSAVTFLTTAFGLRLGLWLRYGTSAASRRGLGRLFFAEMFGQTQATIRMRENPLDSNKQELLNGAVHLSDGGHFENLALYELVRRHCRYIIVSDCGQDPQITFEDFGNAQRRIREDFGVEIEIDLDPLKPGSGTGDFSQQHMVVGTIHYDSPSGVDKGILLYFKPTLTGDEPADIYHYKTRNTDFPHESTGDQFYDEAQWESYRRLGEHAARSALRFVERLPKHFKAEDAFTEARWEWYPMPADLPEQFARLSQSCTAFEADFRDHCPPALWRQFYSELTCLDGAAVGAAPPSMAMSADEQTMALHWLLQMTQFMEEVVIGCHLDTHSNHPLNVGWLNLFQRWVNAPSFRLWWPIIEAQYGPALRNYVKNGLGPFGISCDNRAHVRTALDHTPRAQEILALLPSLRETSSPGRSLVWYELELDTSRLLGVRTEPVVIAAVRVKFTDKELDWNSEDFVIAPGLWGVQLGTNFLKKMLKMFSNWYPYLRICRITFGSLTGAGSLEHNDAGSRRKAIDLVDFYKSAGFILEENKIPSDGRRTLSLSLPYAQSGAGLLSSND